MRCLWTISVVLAGPVAGWAQDVASGPDRGAKVPALKVFAATGAHKDKEIDYVGERKEKPTVYLFFSADKFDRPMNRFMKALDMAVKNDFDGVFVVAVWLTGDAEKTKLYLPKVQQSVQYEATALTLFAGADGPQSWHINADAHITAIVTNQGKVAATFGYRSINETETLRVREALKKALSEMRTPSGVIT